MCNPTSPHHPQPPGSAWRRRLPYWAVQARLFNAVMRRAAAAAFRGSWATTCRPQLTDLTTVRKDQGRGEERGAVGGGGLRGGGEGL